MVGTRYTTPSEMSDRQAMDEVKQLATGGMFEELGTTGLKRAAGYIDEEFLPQLRGRKAVQVYREMGDNDPITSALLFSITQLLRGVDWPVVPGGKSRADTAAAKLVETCMDDMSNSWQGTISEILSCLQYGWSWHEIVYKRRLGPWQKDGSKRSKYSDGLIGWRKIPIRAQETMQRWVFDETGSCQGMVQLAPPDYKTRTLPIDRSLLFRLGHHKNNPEGRSMLRGSYRPWYYKKRLEEFESIGVERDLAGLPKVTVPAEYLRAAPGTQQYKMVQSMKKMVRSVRRNEQEGIVFPSSYDPESKQQHFAFELMTSGGSRQFNTNELIQRYEQRQLMTVLADFIMVGHQGSTGTYNLHVDKTGIFREALNAVALTVADTFNRHAIPRLFAANGWKPDTLPTIQPGNVDAPDLGQLSQFLTATSQLGFNWGPDADMERYLRHAAGLPELGDDEMEAKRREARMDESARFAEIQTRYLAGRSQLAMAMAQEEQTASGEHTPESAAAAQEMQQGQAQGAQQAAQGRQQLAIGAAGEKRAQQTHERDMATPIPKPASAKSAPSSAKSGSKANKRPAGKR